MIAKSWWGGCLVGALSIGVNSSVLAQVVPDNTLGAESSVVTPDNIQGIESDRIDNGAIRGANLFHSFEQFNIGTGRGAYFSNPVGIENIFSRVTGANRSQIMGRLGVLGNANLFLINPQGIVFGSGASLNVQGSFVATTADAVKLGDRGLFSATQPEASNLLTVSPSAILFKTINAPAIVNRSQAQSIIGQPNSDNGSPGLQVPAGQTLGLIGGNVLVDGGRLTAAGGRIEIGSVAGAGEVSLTSSGNGFELGYDSINEFGDILLSNGAFVDASGEGVRTTEAILSDSSLLSAEVDSTTGVGGELMINTQRLLVRDGAQLSVGTFDESNGGSLQINAFDSVEVIGTSADGQIPSALFAGAGIFGGNAGNLTVNTGRLLVRDGAQLSLDTFGEGNGGSLQINAFDSVEVIGTSADGQLPSALSAGSFESGEAGELSINTGRLLVRDGAQLSVNTFGEGKGGSLQINAFDSVEVIGTSADGQFPSVFSAGSSGSGEAGVLTIDTGRLLVSDGAQLSVNTFGEGKGGRLQINAFDSVEVIGTSADGQFPSVFSARSSGSGEAGVLTIDTGRLLVSDGAEVSSASFEDGTAGNININVRDTLQVDNGTISTNSSRSAGGAIVIKAGDIRLFNDSDIRTDVTSGAGGGGIITLRADSILAFDDSDILSFARDGIGGAITFYTPAFFGENYRPAPGGTNPNALDNNNQVDINATGAVSGVIAIPDVSFIQNSLLELPENQINTDSILANSCIVRRNQPTRGSFTVTGTGGLPQRPGDAQMSSFPTVDVATLPSNGTSSNPHPSWQKGDPIVEPQGVYRLPNGKLMLSRECS